MNIIYEAPFQYLYLKNLKEKIIFNSSYWIKDTKYFTRAELNWFIITSLTLMAKYSYRCGTNRKKNYESQTTQSNDKIHV